MRPEDKPVFLRLEDWQLMGLCIEREAGGESREGQIAVGTVILERVDYRDWDGTTIKQVILKPWQFSWTMPEAGEYYYEKSVAIAVDFKEQYEYGRNISLVRCCGIATGLINGLMPRDADLVRFHCCQYLNPVIAHKTRTKWLASGMRSIKIIGRHEFFADR